MAYKSIVDEPPVTTTGGQDPEKDLRFDPVNYDRQVILTAYGEGTFDAPADTKEHEHAAGVVVKIIRDGNTTAANQSFVTSAKSITFQASATDCFLIRGGASLQLRAVLTHHYSGSKNNKSLFRSSLLRVKHTTIEI
jgi:hypothetical protein